MDPAVDQSSQSTPTPSEVTRDLKGFARINNGGDTFCGASNIRNWADLGYLTTDSHYEIALDALETSPVKDARVAEALASIARSALKNQSGADPDDHARPIVARAIHAIEKIAEHLAHKNPEQHRLVVDYQSEVLARLGDMRFGHGCGFQSIEEIKATLNGQLDLMRKTLRDIHGVVGVVNAVAGETNTYPWTDAETISSRTPYFQPHIGDPKDLRASLMHAGSVSHPHSQQSMTGAICYESPLVTDIPASTNGEVAGDSVFVSPMSPHRGCFNTIPQVRSLTGSVHVAEERDEGRGWRETISRYHREVDTRIGNGFSDQFALEFALWHLSHGAAHPGRYNELKEKIGDAIMAHCHAEKALCVAQEKLEGRSNPETKGLKRESSEAERAAKEAFEKANVIQKAIWGFNIERSPLQIAFREVEGRLEAAKGELEQAKLRFRETTRGYFDAQRALAEHVDSEPVFTPEAVKELKDLYHNMEKGLASFQQYERAYVYGIQEILRAQAALGRFEQKEIAGSLPVRAMSQGEGHPRVLIPPTAHDVVCAIAHIEKNRLGEDGHVTISERESHIADYAAELTHALVKMFNELQVPGAALEPGRVPQFVELARDVISYREHFLPDAEEVYRQRYPYLDEEARHALEAGAKHVPYSQSGPGGSSTTVPEGFIIGRSRLGDPDARL